MKLSATIDLDRVKADALAAIDLAFLRQAEVSPFAHAHAEKASHAAAVLDGGHSDAIAAEAEIRGVSSASLSAQILAKRDAQAGVVLALDLERQRVKARVRAATDQHAILAIVAELNA